MSKELGPNKPQRQVEAKVKQVDDRVFIGTEITENTKDGLPEYRLSIYQNMSDAERSLDKAARESNDTHKKTKYGSRGFLSAGGVAVGYGILGKNPSTIVSGVSMLGAGMGMRKFEKDARKVEEIVTAEQQALEDYKNQKEG